MQQAKTRLVIAQTVWQSKRVKDRISVIWKPSTCRDPPELMRLEGKTLALATGTTGTGVQKRPMIVSTKKDTSRHLKSPPHNTCRTFFCRTFAISDSIGKFWPKFRKIRFERQFFPLDSSTFKGPKFHPFTPTISPIFTASGVGVVLPVSSGLLHTFDVA